MQPGLNTPSPHGPHMKPGIMAPLPQGPHMQPGMMAPLPHGPHMKPGIMAPLPQGPHLQPGIMAPLPQGPHLQPGIITQSPHLAHLQQGVMAQSPQGQHIHSGVMVRSPHEPQMHSGAMAQSLLGRQTLGRGGVYSPGVLAQSPSEPRMPRGIRRGVPKQVTKSKITNQSVHIISGVQSQLGVHTQPNSIDHSLGHTTNTGRILTDTDPEGRTTSHSPPLAGLQGLVNLGSVYHKRPVYLLYPKGGDDIDTYHVPNNEMSDIVYSKRGQVSHQSSANHPQDVNSPSTYATVHPSTKIIREAQHGTRMPISETFPQRPIQPYINEPHQDSNSRPVYNDILNQEVQKQPVNITSSHRRPTTPTYDLTDSHPGPSLRMTGKVRSRSRAKTKAHPHPASYSQTRIPPQPEVRNRLPLLQEHMPSPVLHMKCRKCDSNARLLCSGCRRVAYCSQTCQVRFCM